MPVIRCPNCRESVEIESDWYGRRIACPSCDARFTPERPDRRDDLDDRPRRRDRDYDDRDDDRPRRRRRYDDAPSRKKGGAGLWIVLALVGVLVVLPCVGCIGFVVWGMNAEQSFDGPWADHSAGSNAEVTASFPKTPSIKFPNVIGSINDDMTGYDNTLDGSNPLDAIFAVGYFDFPAGTPDPIAAHYPEIRQAIEDEFQIATVLAATVDQERHTTLYGYPAKEATYSEEDGRYTLQVVHVNDRPPGSPTRLVVVFVGGMNMKDADKQKFLNSVRIGKK